MDSVDDSSPPQVLPNGIITHCKVNSGSLKEKTPMCLVNELARYNQIPHQYRLTHEDGPAHKKVFTVTLKLGNEEYQADGSSIKKAQHSAAQLALNSTTYKHPPEKSTKPITSRRNITPTVELNALAMKRGEVTEYTFSEVPPHAPGSPDGYHQHGRFRGRGIRGFRGFKRGFYHTRGARYEGNPIPGAPFPEGIYKVVLKVGDREYTGSGTLPQSARHDAATQALNHMRELMAQDDQENGEEDTSCMEKKSPVSLVHEMALKRKLTVSFEVVEEKGQPHMRVYYTRCTVGDLVTMGEGNGKKISKGKAAELMLLELVHVPEVIPEAPKSRFKRRVAPSVSSGKMGRRKSGRNGKMNEENEPPLDKPINRDGPCYIQELAAYMTSQGEVEPVYKVVETKVMPNTKKKEFTMQVSIGDKSIVAVSSNKKAAMRNAAHMMLIELGQTLPKEPTKKRPKKPRHSSKTRSKRETQHTNGMGTEEELVSPPPSIQGGAPLPATPVGGAGMLSTPLGPDQTARIAAEYLAQGASPTAEALSHHRPRRNRKQVPPPSQPKDQLTYLARIANFTVTYSDFPNPNSQSGPGAPTQGFLSLVNLSTSPPQVCSGVGTSIEQSQNEAAISALKFLSDMGLQSMSPLKSETPVSQHNNKSNIRHFPLNNGGPPVTPPFPSHNNGQVPRPHAVSK